MTPTPDSTVSQPPTRPQARRATKQDMPVLTETLTRSFAREPFHQWMVPDPQAWAEKAPRYFTSYLKIVMRDGVVETVNDGAGVAMWLSSDNPGGILTRLSVPFVLWRLTGTRFPEVSAVLPRFDEHRPKEPHWYLDMLGVAPEQSRKGLGAALLERGFERCDAEGKPAALDTLSQDTVHFYQRHGFDVSASFSLPSGLTVWAMVRPPATS